MHTRAESRGKIRQCLREGGVLNAYQSGVPLIPQNKGGHPGPLLRREWVKKKKGWHCSSRWGAVGESVYQELNPNITSPRIALPVAVSVLPPLLRIPIKEYF